MGRKGKKNFYILLGTSSILLLVLLFLSIIWGSVKIDIISSLQTLFGSGGSEGERVILLGLRVPRALSALFVGAGLSLVGATFQGIFCNPMADPFILGVSSGAALGGTIGIMLGLSLPLFFFSGVALSAFIGGLITIVILFAIAKALKKRDMTGILLAGVAISYFALSITSIMMFLARDKVEEIIFWTMGSLNTATYEKLLLLVLVIGLGSVFLLLNGRSLNGLLVGDDVAKSLGFPVERLQISLVLVSTLMVAVTVAVAGVIGFVGLIVPHIVRLFVGGNYRRVLPCCITVGGAFMVLCDLIGRIVIVPYELPVGAITALIGGPFFIVLLIKNRRRGI